MYDDHDERVKVKAQALQNSPAAMMLRSIHASMDRSLRAMLDSTNHLRCTDPRDKVYAILNVVSSGHQGIEADYTVTLPDLMNQILRNMHAAQTPEYLLDVDMQCRDLEAAFNMSPGSIYGTESEALAACPFPLTDLTCTRPDDFAKNNIYSILQEVHAWCRHYNHRVVAQMIRQQLPRYWVLKEINLEARHKEISWTLRSFKGIYRA